MGSRKFSLSLFTFLLSGCATVNVYEMPKVQANLSQALTRTDALAQKVQTDFIEKKTLTDNLRKMDAPAFRAAESSLRGHLARMQTSLDRMATQRKAMVTANGELASLAYNKREVHSGEADYAKVDQAVKAFGAAAAIVNQENAVYSRESNTMTDEVAAKRLFFGLDPAEFDKRVQQNVKIAQDNLQSMHFELDRANKLMAHGGDKTTTFKVQEGIVRDMANVANQYTLKSQNLSQIQREVRQLTPEGKISSLDPHWSEVQEKIGLFDKTIQELVQLNSHFLNDVERFKAPVKRTR